MEILNYHVSDGQSGIRIDRYLSEKNEIFYLTSERSLTIIVS